MARNREFDDALDELKMLHDAKNQDYATAENPYKNLEGVSRIGIEPWRGIVIRLMDKFERVEQYCTNGELAIKSEGMEDTFKDIAVYSTLAMILFRKEQEKDQELTDAEIDKALIEKGKRKEFELPKFEDPPEWDLPASPSLFQVDNKHNGDDTTQQLTEVERGKDAGNQEDDKRRSDENIAHIKSSEDKFWDKEIEKRQEDARRAVMRWRENGAIS
jgi:hypothetical protein